MYCEKCKKEFSDDRRFCTECGSPLVEKKKGGWKAWHTIILIAGILTLFAVIGVLIIALVVFGLFKVNRAEKMPAMRNEIVSEYEAEDDDYDDSGNVITGEEPDYGNPNQQSTPAYPSSNSDFVLPDSSARYLTKNDLYGLTAEQCRIARNEIYARHGRIFNDEGLQAYFNQFSWYQPTIPADAFQESMLNAYEIANRDLIVEYEKEQGYR